MPPKKVELFTIARDQQHFLQFFNQNNKKLMIIDVHPSWSGPCEALYNTYKLLQTSVIDQFQKRVDIVMIDQEKLINFKNDKFTATSRPKILLAIEGKILVEINDANIPELDENVRKYVPYI